MTKIKIPKVRVSLESLGLINQGLFRVDGDLAKRYHRVLKEVFELDCDVDCFRIDKRGLSPELSQYFKEKHPDRFEYGENYLNLQSASRYAIIISPDQKHAPLIAPQTSYDDNLIDLVYSQAKDTIEDVTQDEALYGKLDLGIDIFKEADDILRVRQVHVHLDTLEETVQKLVELRRLSKGLDEGNNALDPEYVKRTRSLVKEVGDVRQRAVTDVFPIKQEILSFYAEFFNKLHCLRRFKNAQGVRAIYIHHNQCFENKYGKEILFIEREHPHMLSTLHKFGFIEYSVDHLAERIAEIEDQFMLERNIDVLELTPEDRTRYLVDNSSQLPPIWKDLREIEKITATTSASIDDVLENTDCTIRLKLAKAKKKPEVINHLLAELDPTNVSRLYQANRKKLTTEFPELPINKKRYIAYKILESLGGE